MHESTTSTTTLPSLGTDGGQRQAPETCITGADCTPPVVALDWLSVTFPPEFPLAAVLVMFGESESGWQDMGRGRHGYKRGQVKGAIEVYSEGQPKMGIHVRCSGEGCRQLESAGIVTDWREFLRYLQKRGGASHADRRGVR